MSRDRDRDKPATSHESNPSSSSSSSSSSFPVPNKPPSLLAAVKQSPKIIGWCLALTSAILLYGYDLVIVGNVSSMPEFQRDFGRLLNNNNNNNKLIIPSLWLGLWNIANPLGGILGALTAGLIQDRHGRRPSLTLASLLSALSVAVAFTANRPAAIAARRAVFFAAKLVQGFAVNMAMCSAQTYMSEILPPLLRGPVLALFPVFTLLGQLVGSVVVYVSLGRPGADGYRRCFASQWPFSALLLLVAVWMPESPTFHVKQGRGAEARRCQGRLASRSQDADGMLEEVRVAIELEARGRQSSSAAAAGYGNGNGYLDCFRGAVDRRRTGIVLFANLVPQLFGLTLLAKASYFLQTVGMGATDSLLFLQIGVALGLVANVVGMWTLARFGRVVLVYVGLGVATVLWTAVGVAGIWGGMVTVWWTAVSLMLIIAVCGASTWPVSYVVGAEASSLRLRGKSQGLGWLVNSLSNGIFGLVLPYIFNPDEGALAAKTGFVYTGFCLIALVVAWRIVPEMKNRTPMEIDRMFELGLPSRQFKSWVPAEENIRGGGVISRLTLLLRT